MTGAEYVNGVLSNDTPAMSARHEVRGWERSEVAAAYEAGKAEGIAQVSNSVMEALRGWLPPLPEARKRQSAVRLRNGGFPSHRGA